MSTSRALFTSTAVIAASIAAAHADLVTEPVQPGAAQAPEVSREDDRESTRRSLGASENARTRDAYGALAAAPAPEVEIQNVSKSELMRRERVRQELRNEDVLQERLEELRLRDERRRAEQIMGSGGAASEDALNQDPLRVESVAPPVTEAVPGQEPALSRQQAAAALAAPAPADAVGYSRSSIAAELAAEQALREKEEGEKTVVSVSPRVGMGTMSASAGYNVQSRYSAGVGLGVGVSENLSFEAGYTYGEYGVLMASSNAYVYNIQAYTGTQEALAYKQNVFEAGLRLNLLDPSSRVRPFVGVGGGYGKSFMNYDSRIISALTQAGYQNLARDYEVQSVLGSLSAGLDVRLSKSVSVGAAFKYYATLTSRENQPLYNAAFAGYNPAYYGGFGGGFAPYYNGVTAFDADKQLVGGSLARSSFYNVSLGVNFTF